MKGKKETKMEKTIIHIVGKVSPNSLTAFSGYRLNDPLWGIITGVTIRPTYEADSLDGIDLTFFLGNQPREVIDGKVKLELEDFSGTVGEILLQGQCFGFEFKTLEITELTIECIVEMVIINPDREEEEA